MPRVLEEIREEWQDAHSLSRLAAEDLVGMLKAKAANADRHKGVGSQRAIDVLITGVENSLWVSTRAHRLHWRTPSTGLPPCV